MRTKSLLTAGALAMLMAACSNEELELSNSQLNENRPSAGDVVLTPGLGGEESRAVWENAGWTWGAGDKFGAMLMDTWNQLGTGFDNYSFTDYIHTNYPFTTEDGKIWKSVAGAPLCEGNYFFTWPFKPELTSRGGVYFEVEATQSNVDENGKVDAIIPVKEQQKYLGYAFVEAAEGDVNEVDAKFHYVFANPKFKIENLTGVSLKVLKLLVRAHETPGAVPSLLPTKVQLTPANWNKDAAKNYTDGLLTSKQETAELQNVLTPILDETATYEYVIDCGDNYIVENGNNIRVSVVMPGGQYGSLDVYAFVEKQNEDKQCGVIRLNETGNVEWDGQSQAGPMQTNLKPGVTQLYTATLYPQSIGNLGVQGFTVVTSEDLAFVIDLKAKYAADERVKITTWGDKVELTKEVVDLIKVEDRENIEWYIDGTIVIPADAPANAIDLLSTDANFAQTTIINKGKQVLSKSVYYCNIVNEGTIVEAENVDVAINGHVINGSEDNKDAELVVTTIAGSVKNYGTIKVDVIFGSTWNADGRIDNYGHAEVGKVCNVKNYSGATMIMNNCDDSLVGALNGGWTNEFGAELTFAGGIVSPGYNYGVLNVTGETLTAYLHNYEDAVINVNADFEIGINAENFGTINIAAGKEMSFKTRVGDYDYGIANCEGGVINVKGILAHDVYNSGLINVIEDGIVEVKGIMTQKAGPWNSWKNFIDSYDVVGTIDVTAANATTSAQAAKCGDDKMYFAYTVAEETTAIELVDALKARISSANYGINPIKLTWAATSATEFGGKLLTPNVTEVTINNSLTLNAYTSFPNVADDKFVVNGILTVANGQTLEVPTVCIVVDGTLKANNHSSLKGNATVCGEGKVIIATAENNTWTKDADFEGEWIE